MRSMTFLVNDRATGSGPTPAVAVTVTENADGTVSISINVVGGVTGDLRGFFFDVANESRIGTLSVTPTSPGFTEFRQGNDSVRDLGNGANMNGLLGSDGGLSCCPPFIFLTWIWPHIESRACSCGRPRRPISRRFTPSTRTMS